MGEPATARQSAASGTIPRPVLRRNVSFEQPTVNTPTPPTTRYPAPVPIPTETDSLPRLPTRPRPLARAVPVRIPPPPPAVAARKDVLIDPNDPNEDKRQGPGQELQLESKSLGQLASELGMTGPVPGARRGRPSNLDMVLAASVPDLRQAIGTAADDTLGSSIKDSLIAYGNDGSINPPVTRPAIPDVQRQSRQDEGRNRDRERLGMLAEERQQREAPDELDELRDLLDASSPPPPFSPPPTPVLARPTPTPTRATAVADAEALTLPTQAIRQGDGQRATLRVARMGRTFDRSFESYNRTPVGATVPTPATAQPPAQPQAQPQLQTRARATLALLDSTQPAKHTRVPPKHGLVLSRDASVRGRTSARERESARAEMVGQRRTQPARQSVFDAGVERAVRREATRYDSEQEVYNTRHDEKYSVAGGMAGGGGDVVEGPQLDDSDEL